MQLSSVIIMAIAISISMSEQSRAVIAQWRQAPQLVAAAITTSIDRILVDVENHLKVSYLSGPTGSGASGGTPVGLRSGALRQAVDHERTDELGGYVGTTEGPTSSYAAVILGDQVHTIKPRHANHLWVPIADNLNPSGIARWSPRAAMELTGPTGKRLLRIFKSKRGNIVAFLPEFAATGQDDYGNAILKTTGARFARGKNKGRQKGKLLFVLKDQVTVTGTDALVKATQDRVGEAARIFDDELGKVRDALNGGQA